MSILGILGIVIICLVLFLLIWFFICYQIKIVVIFLLIVPLITLFSFYIYPNNETRYIPEVAIVASDNGENTINLNNIQIGKTFILQIATKINNNSIARRLLGNNKISCKIEISSGDKNIISKPKNIKLTNIEKTELTENSVIYYFNVNATKNPPNSIIEFDITPKEEGEQQIKVTFDDKVSPIYSRVQTLKFVGNDIKEEIEN